MSCSLKTNIKDPFLSGFNAFSEGKSIYYDPYRNMSSDFHKERALWHKGYDEARKKK